jgi:hypothetical protein
MEDVGKGKEEATRACPPGQERSGVKDEVSPGPKPTGTRPEKEMEPLLACGAPWKP